MDHCNFFSPRSRSLAICVLDHMPIALCCGVQRLFPNRKPRPVSASCCSPCARTTRHPELVQCSASQPRAEKTATRRPRPRPFPPAVAARDGHATRAAAGAWRPRRTCRLPASLRRPARRARTDTARARSRPAPACGGDHRYRAAPCPCSADAGRQADVCRSLLLLPLVNRLTTRPETTI